MSDNTSHFLTRIQISYNFSDLEMARMKYTLKALSSEFIKTILLSILFYKLGYLPQFIAGILILASIRWNCGGLHMEHFITCLLFTLGFTVLTIIILPAWLHVPSPMKAIVLLVCIAATYRIGPISSSKRPSVSASRTNHYRKIAVILLILYSALILLLKTNPYADICFWIIVLQTAQLIRAKILQKGEPNEEIQQQSSL